MQMMIFKGSVRIRKYDESSNEDNDYTISVEVLTHIRAALILVSTIIQGKATITTRIPYHTAQRHLPLCDACLIVTCDQISIIHRPTKPSQHII